MRLVLSVLLLLNIDLQAKENSFDIFQVNAKGGLRVRLEPNSKSEVISNIPNKSYVYRIEDTKIEFISEKTKGTWFKVVYNFTIGYAFSGFLESASEEEEDKIPYTFIDDDSHMYHPDNSGTKSIDKSVLLASSYNFTYPPRIGSKIFYFPLDTGNRKPIELLVKKVVYNELDDTGDASITGYNLHNAKIVHSRFEVKFENITNIELINSLDFDRTYMKGIIIHPFPKSIECLPKKKVKKHQLPNNYELSYLEYAIDTNNDGILDIAKFDITDDYTERWELWKKDSSNSWEIIKKVQTKNYSYDEKKKGFYPAQYLCK
ncbi:MAG: SH3 domain-containing protein [Leptospiraceae bacterium]|nr:SH3 domain-containing protein [Leptospiraceae bacterium]